MARLFLIPNIISSESIVEQLPADIKKVIENINIYIVEDIRNARRFIRSIDKEKNIDQIVFFELNKHTEKNEIPSFLKPVFEGKDIGLISEAGVPCVADPGSVIVDLAHQKDIEVVPLVGPSSILLALMASGMNGQQFCFHGYLPVQKNERIQAIKQLENNAARLTQTQIFIETPYRNNQLLADIISTCKDTTKVCIASEILSINSMIKTLPVNKWKKNLPDLHKKTVVFIIGV